MIVWFPVVRLSCTQAFLTITEDALISQMKMRLICAVGSLPRFLSKRLEVEQVTGCISNWSVWYAPHSISSQNNISIDVVAVK